MGRRKKDQTTLKAYVGRIEDGCKRVKDESVDVAVFSPPYFERDGYTMPLMREIGRLLGRVLKPGARAFMNFGQIKEDLERPMKAHRLLLHSSSEDDHDHELVAGQQIIWVKSIAMGGWSETCDSCNTDVTVPLHCRGHVQPINSDRLLNYSWEYVFTYTKGLSKDAPPLDRLAIGVPYADKSNLTRGTRGKNGDLRCAGDIWFIPYKTTGSKSKKRHQHSYPLELARRCIRLSGVPQGSLVFDPFMGGGTTAIAARLCGMNAVSYDCDKASLATAIKLWKEHSGERWRLDGIRQ